MLTVALIVAAGALACAPAEPPPSMVIVVIDTLRADHLGAYGYEANPTSPNLDARASSAALFDNAFSTAPWTLPAFGSLLTAQLPTRHSAGSRFDLADVGEEEGPLERMVKHGERLFFELDESLPTLGSEFQQAGYRTAAIVSNAFLSPEFGLDRGFDTYAYDKKAPSRRRASTVTDLALEWLRQHDEDAAGQPFLLLVHYFDPHMPYRAPEPFFGKFARVHGGDEFDALAQDVTRLRYRVRDRTEGWERYMAFEQALYDEEIAYADAELERLMTALDAGGFSDKGYILLTSDHGEEFHDHGWGEHGHTVYDELLRVPLMVWGPGVEPGRYQLPVSLVDIMPTLLDIAGSHVEADFQGDTLWPVLVEGPASRTASALRFDRPLFAERVLYGDEKKALIRWPWKLCVDVEDSAQLLYNLQLDPGEMDGSSLDDLDEEGRDLMFAMLAELQEVMVEAGAHGHRSGASLSEDTLRTLRGLGYIR